MGFLVARLDEVLHMETLAHQAALHVDQHTSTVSISPEPAADFSSSKVRFPAM
jgi:hypothetical protein